ncbi:MAG: hypothetical protein RSF40_04875 [Oscillospiraceae bacterium]
MSTQKKQLTPIKTYKVQLTYFKRTVGADAQIFEEEVKDNVEVTMLARTSVAHTSLATDLIQYGGSSDLSQITPIASRMAKTLICDTKIAECISSDDMCCIDFFYAKEVQEDIERFLSNWDFLKRMEKPQEKQYPKE